MRTIDIASEIAVGLGKAGSITVKIGDLNDTMLARVFMYGLKQILNDAHASEKEADKKLALTEKRLASLYAGELRKARETSGRTVDAVGKEAKRIAQSKVMAFGRTKLEEAAKRRGSTFAEFVKFTIDTLAAREDIIAQAKANVAATAELDLGDDFI